MKNFSIFSFLLGCLLGLSACTDEILTDSSNGLESEMQAVSVLSRAYPSDNSGLQLMNDGTWKAFRTVPLTGAGRTIGNMSAGLVTVLDGNIHMDNLLNHDLTDKASVVGLASANALFGHLFSVRDLYRTYSGGQKAGFVYGVNNSGLLTAEVIKLFTLTLYNDGKLLKTFNLSEAGGVLGLNLINIENTNGIPQMSISVEVPTDLKFDEIAFGVAGVDAAVLNSMEFYYAFVGETPIKTTVVGSAHAYSHPSIYRQTDPGWSNWALQGQLVDRDPHNGPTIEVVGGLLNALGGGFRTTVNFGEPIAAGSEVGFVYTSGDILNLGLGNTIHLATYSANPDKGAFQKAEPPIEKYTAGAVLGASLIGGGKNAVSFVTQKDFQNLYLNIVGLNVKLGVMQFHYAYTRAKTVVDATSYFNFPEKLNTVNSYVHVYMEDPAAVKVHIDSQPAGGNAQYDPTHQVIKGMNVDGDYQVTFTYQKNGQQFTQRSILTKTHTTHPVGCNQLITSRANGAQVGEKNNTGELLCLICPNALNPEALLDDDLNTCMKHIGALELIGNNNLVTVNHISNLKVSPNGYRAGFILQANQELLSLNALNFLYVDVFKQGKKLERSVSGSRPTVDLGLLNGQQGKLRVGVTLPAGTEAFDEIRLYSAGVLALNFTTLRLYGVFYEPADQQCADNGVSEACMEMLTPANCGAAIHYPQTHFRGVAGIANGMYSLDQVLDDDKHTKVTIPHTSVVGGSRLAITFKEMPANQTVGVMIQQVGAIATADLLTTLDFEAYHRGVRVDRLGDEKDLLQLKVIGHGDKSYLELHPMQPFDELRLTNKGVLPALKDLNVYGFYTRTDSNGDGIPDCGEDPNSSQSPDLYPSASTHHFCEKDKMVIHVAGGTKGQSYVLKLKKYDSELLDTPQPEIREIPLVYDGSGLISIDGVLTPGVYLVDFYKTGTVQPSFSNMKLYVHPLQATWTGNGKAGSMQDWNHWKNWVEGAPWGCTDVVIPAGCLNYPVLQAQDDNYCARILFAANAHGETGEVIHTHHLTYDQAWVDKAFEADQYQLVAAVLKDTYTGDVFPTSNLAASPVPQNYLAARYSACWLSMEGEVPSPHFRFEPQVYQHTFGGPVVQVTPESTELLHPGDSHWTPAFNLVAERYELGKAYLVKMGKMDAAPTPYYLRWPKLHPAYEYYLYEAGHPVLQGKTEHIARTAGQTGRFIYETNDGKALFPLHLFCKNERPGDLYLFGNPFMAHLNLKSLLEANLHVGEIWLVRKGAPGTPGTYVKVNRKEAETTNEQIRPSEGFLVRLRAPYTDRNRYQCYLHLTEAMLEQTKVKK